MDGKIWGAVATSSSRSIRDQVQNQPKNKSSLQSRIKSTYSPLGERGVCVCVKCNMIPLYAHIKEMHKRAPSGLAIGH